MKRPQRFCFQYNFLPCPVPILWFHSKRRRFDSQQLVYLLCSSCQGDASANSQQVCAPGCLQLVEFSSLSAVRAWTMPIKVNTVILQVLAGVLFRRRLEQVIISVPSGQKIQCDLQATLLVIHRDSGKAMQPFVRGSGQLAVENGVLSSMEWPTQQSIWRTNELKEIQCVRQEVNNTCTPKLATKTMESPYGRNRCKYVQRE